MKTGSTIKQTKFALLAAICCLAGLQGGCAEQHAYKDVASHIPALQPGYARIYLYSVSGRLIQSYRFDVDGKEVGKVNGSECLYVDHLPGNCTVNCYLEGTGLADSMSFILSAGETRYIQIQKDVSLTGKITLASIPAAQATSDLDRCEYVGPNLAGMPK